MSCSSRRKGQGDGAWKCGCQLRRGQQQQQQIWLHAWSVAEAAAWRRRCVLYSQAALLWWLLCPPLHPLPALEPQPTPPPLAGGWALIFMNRNNLTVWGNMRVCCQYLCFQQVLYSLSLLLLLLLCFLWACCLSNAARYFCLSSWQSRLLSSVFGLFTAVCTVVHCVRRWWKVLEIIDSCGCLFC